MRRSNTWAKMYGDKRRAKDRAILEAAERAIEAEEAALLQRIADDAHAQWLEDEARELDEIQNQRRKELALLTGKNLRTI